MVLAVDRTGKGLRTAPRDALISLSTPPETQGRAFGVHRAMDTAGALLGPLVAFLILRHGGRRLRRGVRGELCVARARRAGAGAVRAGTRAAPRTTRPRPGRGRRCARRSACCGGPGLRRARVCALLLGLATVSDSFVYLLLQRRARHADRWFPLLPLGTAAAFLLLAVPLGALADRIGPLAGVPRPGTARLLGAYACCSGPGRGRRCPYARARPARHVLRGHRRRADGAAGPLIPEELRASGLALLQTGQALGPFRCSLAFGAAWTRWGPENTIQGFAVALTAAVLLCMVLLRPGAAHGPEVADV